MKSLILIIVLSFGIAGCSKDVTNQEDPCDLGLDVRVINWCGVNFFETSYGVVLKTPNSYSSDAVYTPHNNCSIVTQASDIHYEAGGGVTSGDCDLTINGGYITKIVDGLGDVDIVI